MGGRTRTVGLRLLGGIAILTEGEKGDSTLEDPTYEIVLLRIARMMVLLYLISERCEQCIYAIILHM